MSTNSIVVGRIRCGLTIAASASSRGSGTPTTPTLGSMVQNGKFAAGMPALVKALKSVDLPTLGRPTMPHLMPMDRPMSGIGIRQRSRCWHLPRSRIATRRPARGWYAVAASRRSRSPVKTRGMTARASITAPRIAASSALPGPAQHPGRDPVPVAWMSDAQAQPVELAVAQLPDDVAQAVLATVPAIELEPGRARWQVQLIVRHQHLLGLDLVVRQRAQDRQATAVHVGRGAQQPEDRARHARLGDLGVQLAVQRKRHAQVGGQGIDEPEPGVVPGSGMLGTGIAQPDDEA